jgi:hypothetical protein
MAQITETLRDNNLVGTSVINRPTCADDIRRLSGKDRIDGRFVREAVIELDGSPRRPFLVQAWRQGKRRQLSRASQ